MPHTIRIIILPVAALFGFALIWLLAKPVFENARSLSLVKKPQLEMLIQRENDMQQRTQKLINADSDGEQLAAIINALPDTPETKNLIAQIEYLVNQESMTLTNILLTGESAEDLLTNGIFGQTGKKYRELQGSIEVQGSYSQFKHLLGEFPKINRIVNIKQITLTSTSGEEGGTTGKYNIVFTSYWQPAITPQDIQSGLESMESSPSNSSIPGIPVNQNQAAPAVTPNQNLNAGI